MVLNCNLGAGPAERLGWLDSREELLIEIIAFFVIVRLKNWLGLGKRIFFC